MDISHEQIEVIGKSADTLDNLVAASVLPLSAEKKLQYTLDSLKALSETLKGIYAQVSGENPWAE